MDPPLDDQLLFVSIPLIVLLKELFKESRGGAPDGPVCKSPAATEERAGLRGEYESCEQTRYTQ
jgi:hypothetical protein